MKKPKSAEPARWSAAVPSRSDQFQLKRMALIREAGKAFGRRGFHNTSLDDVAQVLGVTKPALYYYVKTKEEILFECHLMALDLGDHALDRAYAEVPSPGRRLRLFLEYYIEALAGDMGGVAVLTEPMSSLTDEYRATVVARRDAFDRTFRTLIKDAIREGTITPCDPKLVVSFFMAVPNTLGRWYSPDGPIKAREVAASFARFVFEGIGNHEAPLAAPSTTASLSPATPANPSSATPATPPPRAARPARVARKAPTKV